MNKNVEIKRNQYIGGSDYPIITGSSSFKKINELAGEKAGLLENNFKGNVYTEFGNFAEPIIRDWINLNLGYDFQEDTFFKELDGSLELRGNVDGYDENKNTILEIKTSSNFHEQMYLDQLRFYQNLVPNSKGIIVGVERTPEMLEMFNNEQYEALKYEIESALSNDMYLCIESKKVLKKEREEIEKTCIDFTDLVNAIALSGNINYNTLPQEYEQQVLDISRQFLAFSELEKQIKAGKQKLFEIMATYGVKNIKNDYASISRVDPTLPTEKVVVELNEDLTQEQIDELIKQKVLVENVKKTNGRAGYVKITPKK